MSAAVHYILLCTYLASLASAGNNLRGHRAAKEALAEKEDLLAESERFIHRLEQFGMGYEEAVRARMHLLEVALQQSFKLAPKDERGLVDSKAARYILHHFFVQRHQWHVNLLEDQEGIGNTLQGGGNGFNLRDLAHFAATVEQLVHAENIERLQYAFDALGFSREQQRSDEAVEQALEAYFVIFLASNPQRPWTRQRSYPKARRMITHGMPTFNSSIVVAREVANIISETRGPEFKLASLWKFCLEVVEQVAESFGREHKRDCQDLKSQLMKMETPGSGRVPLDAFWGGMFHTTPWYFYESEPYLKQLGALGEEQGLSKTVRITNYLYSSANCASGTQHYQLCCPNECQGILSDIEGRIGAPAATPRRLADAVQQVKSSTVSAPRQLSARLLKRLDEIAARHGNGEVPLHGRLFAQLLHHEYPLECPYPHPQTNSSFSASERIRPGTMAAFASRDVVVDYLEKVSSQAEELSSELPWSEEEEPYHLQIV